MNEPVIDLTKLAKSEATTVAKLVRAMRTPCDIDIHPSSKLVTRQFMEVFTHQLLINHVFLRTPLFQQSFDRAFCDALIASGRSVKEAPTGCRFYDLEVDGKNYSLKTTKEKKLKKESLNISKLFEAAWIQDCRSARIRREKTLQAITGYLNAVTAIYQLRYFAEEDYYELVEISTSLFEGIFTVSLDCFDSDGPSINIKSREGDDVMTLSLDRSDAKITLKNIRKKHCFVHGTWSNFQQEEPGTDLLASSNQT